jgi:hypothetical protein
LELMKNMAMLSPAKVKALTRKTEMSRRGVGVLFSQRAKAKSDAMKVAMDMMANPDNLAEDAISPRVGINAMSLFHACFLRPIDRASWMYGPKK